MRVLIDADIYLFKAATRSEVECNFGNDIYGLACDINEVRQRFEDSIDEVTEQVGCSEHQVILTFTDKKNWRHGFYPEYKSNRKGKRKPIGFAQVREWARKKAGALIFPGLEADDVMGIFSTKWPDSLIVSIDKDLATIPGNLFNPSKDDAPRSISREEADRFFYAQVLTGDSTDGYSGCPGVGPVRAAKILDPLPYDEAAFWAAVVNTYNAKGLTYQDALTNARMARICRDGDWNFETEEMTWTPPTI